MDKIELKKILKPLIKESIKEVLMEQGLLSLVKQSLVSETTVKQPSQQIKQKVPIQENLKEKARIEALENRKKMLEEIGRSSYGANGFNPFQGSTPIEGGPDTLNEVKVDPRGPLKDIDPNDPGVDISGFMGGNKAVWSALLKTKGK